MFPRSTFRHQLLLCWTQEYVQNTFYQDISGSTSRTWQSASPGVFDVARSWTVSAFSSMLPVSSHLRKNLLPKRPILPILFFFHPIVVKFSPVSLLHSRYSNIIWIWKYGAINHRFEQVTLRHSMKFIGFVITIGVWSPSCRWYDSQLQCEHNFPYGSYWIKLLPMWAQCSVTKSPRCIAFATVASSCTRKLSTSFPVPVCQSWWDSDCSLQIKPYPKRPVGLYLHGKYSR